jgi:hypothetical protein
MNGSNKPWDDIHHRSYFLPNIARIKQDDFRSTLSEIVGHVVVPLDTHGIYVGGNMASISPTFMINVSRIPGNIENVYISADSLPEEIMIYTELFKESEMYLLGYMKRCQELTLKSSNIRLKITQMLKLFNKVLQLSIPRRPLLVR